MTGQTSARRWRSLALPLTVAGAFQVSPALAQTRPSDAPPDVVVEGRIQDSDRRVCKQTTSTGSIFLTRTCKTKAEWEQIRERSLAQKEQLFRDREQERFTRLCKEFCGKD